MSSNVLKQNSQDSHPVLVVQGRFWNCQLHSFSPQLITHTPVFSLSWSFWSSGRRQHNKLHGSTGVSVHHHPVYHAHRFFVFILNCCNITSFDYHMTEIRFLWIFIRFPLSKAFYNLLTCKCNLSIHNLENVCCDWISNWFHVFKLWVSWVWTDLQNSSHLRIWGALDIILQELWVFASSLWKVRPPLPCNPSNIYFHVLLEPIV